MQHWSHPWGTRVPSQVVDVRHQEEEYGVYTVQSCNIAHVRFVMVHVTVLRVSHGKRHLKRVATLPLNQF